MQRRRALQIGLGLLVGAPLAVWGVSVLRFPSDRTPQGAYLRIVKAINRGRPEDCFAYLETAAQHAAYSIRDYRRSMRARVLAAYPEPERSRLAGSLREEAEAPDGADVFALHARRHGWIDRLRKDLSGIERVEIAGERATLSTVRGTRYAFRRRENGIWGLTLFTAALVADAEKAARDAAMVEKAARDFERARGAP
jgi:hypothetical protein